MAAALVLVVAGISGCAEKATEAQCDRAYDHLLDVRTAGEPEILKKIRQTKLDKQRPIFLKECVGRAPRAVIECWLAAQTTEAMRACESAR